MSPLVAGSRRISASTYARPPRTLNAPVGRWFSCLTTTSAPSRSAISGHDNASVGRKVLRTTSCARRISTKLNIAKNPHPCPSPSGRGEKTLNQHLALLVDHVVELDARVVLEVGHDHFVVRLARRDHREAVFLLIDEAVENDRFRRL